MSSLYSLPPAAGAAPAEAPDPAINYEIIN